MAKILLASVRAALMGERLAALRLRVVGNGTPSWVVAVADGGAVWEGSCAAAERMESKLASRSPWSSFEDIL